jgi:uncharacterized membrane protein
MNTKEEVLAVIETLAKEHAITRDEVTRAYDQGANVVHREEAALSKKVGIAEVLSYIGGAIVFIGIVIFMGQNWSVLSFETKLLATLGAGIASYLVGVIIGRKEHLNGVSAAFHLIAALVLPTGIFVVFQEAGIDAGDSGVQTIISAILFAMYLASFGVFRKTIFALFSIIFGTWLFFALTSYLVSNNPYFNTEMFYEYRALAIGLTYLLFGYSFAKGSMTGLSGFLYGFGILWFLGSALALGGWEPNQNVFWELFFPALVFATLFLSVQLKSRAFLVFGSLFLIAYIFKITAEYFTEGLGWPLSLVLAGLLMIAVGYMSLTLNKKYIKSNGPTTP